MHPIKSVIKLAVVNKKNNRNFFVAVLSHYLVFRKSQAIEMKVSIVPSYKILPDRI